MTAKFLNFYRIYAIPIVFFSVLPIALCIPLGFIWCWHKCLERKCSKWIIRVLKCCEPWSMHKVVRYMFGDVFKPGDDDSKENPQTIIFNKYYVPNLFVYGLVLLIFQLFSLSLAIFWENFLFKRSSRCVNYYIMLNLEYCFNISDFSSYDCSDEVPVSDIVCFTLAFDWGASFSATGGFFVVLSFLNVVIPWIVLKITNGDQATKKRERTGKKLRCVLIFIMLVISFANIILLIIEHHFNIFYTEKLLQVLALSVTFTIIIGIPWWNFKKVINGMYVCNNDNTESNVRVSRDKYQLLIT